MRTTWKTIAIAALLTVLAPTGAAESQTTPDPHPDGPEGTDPGGCYVVDATRAPPYIYEVPC